MLLWAPAAADAGEAEGPKANSAPGRKSGQDAEKGHTLQVVEDAVIASETPLVASQTIENSRTTNLSRTKANQQNVPARSKPVTSGDSAVGSRLTTKITLYVDVAGELAEGRGRSRGESGVKSAAFDVSVKLAANLSIH